MTKYIYYEEDGTGENFHKVAIDEPKLINLNIQTQEELEKWKKEYESQLNLSKDSMKIVVLLKNKIHHELVRTVENGVLSKRYFKKRLLHFYYYFCVSKGEMCEPEKYYYESSKYSKAECKRPEAYHKVKDVNKNTAIYRCVKTKGLYVGKGEFGEDGNNCRGLEPFIKNKKYNFVPIYYEIINLLPKIFKHYSLSSYNVEAEDYSPFRIGHRKIDWCFELGWLRTWYLHDYFIDELEKRYEIKFERYYQLDGVDYHGRYKDVLIECGREFKKTDEMVVELPNENSTASNNEVKSEVIASGIFTGDYEGKKEAIDLGHDYWIKKDDDNDYETYDTVATDNVIVPQKLANGCTLLKIVVNKRNEILSLIENSLPVLDKLFKKA